MENICRTCLRSPGNLLPLFDNTGLPHKIETICSVQITDTNNLPRKVCAECVININLSYNFRRVIINSDVELKRRILIIPTDETTNDVEEPETTHIKAETAEIEIIENHSSCDVEVKGVKTEAGKDDCNSNKVTKHAEEPKNIAIKRTVKSSFMRSNLQWRRIYKCKKCDFTTSDLAKRYSHKKSHVVAKSVCSICGKCIRPDNLQKHISTHTDAPVTCHICGRVYKNNESLRGHLLSHKNWEKACEYCGEVFKHRGGYQRHVRKQHSLEPNARVKCTFCDKTFFEKGDLKKHIRSHTGERPYPCEYCKKGFSSSHALKTHIRRHTNEKPYTCEFCPAAFPQRVSLRTHLKSKHPDKEHSK